MDYQYPAKHTRVDKLIRDTFADLLEKEDFASIKVSEIISTAGVSRSAFYSHYEDKFDLIEKIEQEMIEGFHERMMSVQNAGSIRRRKEHEEEVTGELEADYFRFILMESRWWQLFMSGRGRSDFVQRLTHMMFNQFMDTAAKWYDAKDNIVSLDKGFVMGAWSYVGIISYWIETGMKESPDEMGRVLAIYWYRYKKSGWLPYPYK